MEPNIQTSARPVDNVIIPENMSGIGNVIGGKPILSGSGPTFGAEQMSVPQNKSSIGGIIGTIIIIALIILGGLYFWGKHVDETQSTQNALMDNSGNATQEPMDEAAMIKSTSSADDLDSLDADLQNTSTADLGTELTAQ